MDDPPQRAPKAWSILMTN